MACYLARPRGGHQSVATGQQPRIGCVRCLRHGFSCRLPRLTSAAISCSCRAYSGASLIDSASASFSVESVPYIYPRYCFATNFVSGALPSLDVSNLNAWRCNGYQLYDVSHRQATPYAGGSGWANLSNTIINTGTFESWIAQAKQRSAFTFLFNDMGTADNTYAVSGEARQCRLAGCSTPPACHRLGVTLELSGRWRRELLWRHRHISRKLAEPLHRCDRSDEHRLADVTRPKLISILSTPTVWTGSTLDTLGDPSCTVYKATGATMSYSGALGSIYTAMQSSTGFPMVHPGRTASSCAERAGAEPDVLPVRTAPEFCLSSILRLDRNQREQHTDHKRFVARLYSWSIPTKRMHKRQRHARPQAGTGTCYFNPPGVYYKDDMLMASGTWPMDITDGTDNGVHLVSNIYVPGTAGQLAMSGTLLQGQADRRNFGVAYESCCGKERCSMRRTRRRAPRSRHAVLAADRARSM